MHAEGMVSAENFYLHELLYLTLQVALRGVYTGVGRLLIPWTQGYNTYLRICFRY